VKHLRIVIVDDHEVVRLGLRALLDRHPDFSVVDEASTAREAKEKALQHHRMWSMDIRLPGGRGLTPAARSPRSCPRPSHHPHVCGRRRLLSDRRRAAGYVLKQIGGDDWCAPLRRSGAQALLDPR
jgi:DNA-binding NarL/FixJ family response regulator